MAAHRRWSASHTTVLTRPAPNQGDDDDEPEKTNGERAIDHAFCWD